MTSDFDTPYNTIGDWPRLAEEAAGAQPTVADHDAVLKAGFDATTRRLLPVEQAFMRNAETQIESTRAERKEMAAVVSDLDAIAELADEGHAVDLEAWQALDARARGLIAKARSAPERAEKLAANLENVLGALDDLEKRMPALRVRPFAR